ncbi:MAG: phospholipase A [Mariprofundaceae bacterium]|nr:phospholipase A [Mariprofundaceae bacterium]
MNRILLFATILFAVLINTGDALAGGKPIEGMEQYRQSYLLFYSYNNQNHFDAVYGPTLGSQYLQNEVKFQISFQGYIYEGDNFDVGLAYTQQSYWQLFNKPLSAPFRENNFEPEVFVQWKGRDNLLGRSVLDESKTLYRIGIDHQSNGRSDPFSRSWNRMYGEVKLAADDDRWIGALRAWLRVPEKKSADNNRDITRFYGFWQFDGRYSIGDADKHKLHVMLRDNLRINDNKGAMQLDWSWKILGNFSTYAQVFYGYGENMIEYNRLNARFGIGILLTNW